MSRENHRARVEHLWELENDDADLVGVVSARLARKRLQIVECL